MQKIFLRVFFTITIGVFPASSSLAATISIPVDYTTIQAGIDAASDGDIVLVSPGTYLERIDFIGKAIVVRSELGPENTTIDGGGLTTDIIGVNFNTAEDYGSVIEGFTITNCGKGVSFGPSSSASPMIIKNIFYANHYAISGYINYQINEVDPFIVRNIIDSNYCGIHLDNQASSYGGADAVIRNNVIVNNTQCGIQLRMHKSLPEIDSNIIAGNNIGIEFTYDSLLEKRKELIQYNNIWNNTANFSAGGVDIDMNGLQGNIASDPLFVDALNRDFHLQPGSPSINTGNPDPQYSDPDSTRNDMGGYGGPLDLIDTLPPGLVSILSSSPAPLVWSNDNTVKVTWEPTADEGLSGLDGYSYSWDTNPGTNPDMIKDIRLITSVTSYPMLDGNEHYFHIRAVDRVNNWGETTHYGPFYLDSSIATVMIYEARTVEPPLDYEKGRLFGINNSGQAVGRFYNVNAITQEEEDSQGFVWDLANGTTLLPTLSGETRGRGINMNEQVAGFSYNAEGFKRAVRWDNFEATINDIGTFYNAPADKWGDASDAYDVNDSGQVTGWAEISNDAGNYTSFHAFIYSDANGIVDIGTLVTTSPEWQNGFSVGYDIIDSGLVVETANLLTGGAWVFRPFIYDEINQIGELSINPDNILDGWTAVVINEGGLIGGHVLSGGNSYPYYWDTRSVPEPVQIAMPADFPYGEIYGINAAGQMVGIMMNEAGDRHAFLFNVTDGIKDLNDLTELSAGSILKSAMDINDSNQIAGLGDFGGQEYGFILRIKDPNDIDIDWDGIADTWETAHFGDIDTADNVSDYDKDGYTDLQEYLNDLAGETDPDSTEYDPKVINAPGGTGYNPSSNSSGSSFWNFMLPAILGGNR